LWPWSTRRHFGKAAEDCFVGQSTLSAGVQELEDLLGVILLERSARVRAPLPRLSRRFGLNNFDTGQFNGYIGSASIT
jgi:Bacterial regulatory helix-turn-helix protein, lysR family